MVQSSGSEARIYTFLRLILIYINIIYIQYTNTVKILKQYREHHMNKDDFYQNLLCHNRVDTEIYWRSKSEHYNSVHACLLMRVNELLRNDPNKLHH